MSRVRQLSHAKYELLSENKRPTVWSTLGVATSVAIIILVTAFATYFSWKTMTGSLTKRIVMRVEEFSKNNSVPRFIWRHRLEAYGSAFFKQNKPGQEPILGTQMNMTSLQQQPPDSNGYKLVCYYPLPKSENSSSELMPESIDPFLCTHIIMAAIGVENCTIKPTFEDIQMYERLMALKAYNDELKIMLSIAGVPSVGGFNDMVALPERRKIFIQEILALAEKSDLDGIDFDWEFPAWESDLSEKVHFTEFLSELQKEIIKKELKLLVSVAVAAPKPIIDVAYDVPQMAELVDFINIMTYDYHFYVWYFPVTGYNAPLYSQTGDEGYFLTLNMNWSVTYWLTKGMPKEKIMVGLPTYGHTFSLLNPDNHNLNAPTTGIGSIGSDGYISYGQVCWFVNNGDATVVFDRNSKVPYTFNAKDWISFENEQSLAYKAEYIVSGGFAGAMVFSLSTDDYKGQCSKDSVKFPLTRRIKLVLTDDEL